MLHTASIRRCIRGGIYVVSAVGKCLLLGIRRKEGENKINGRRKNLRIEFNCQKTRHKTRLCHTIPIGLKTEDRWHHIRMNSNFDNMKLILLDQEAASSYFRSTRKFLQFSCPLFSFFSGHRFQKIIHQLSVHVWIFDSILINIFLFRRRRINRFLSLGLSSASSSSSSSFSFFFFFLS